MADLNLGWLIPTTLQVSGLAIALAVVGFGYEQSIQEQKLFTSKLTEGALVGWLAGAGVIFATGMALSQSVWYFKTIAILLAGMLIGLAWTAPRSKQVKTVKEPREKPTKKTIAWLVARVYIGIFVLLILVWGFSLSLHALHLYGLARRVQADPGQIQAEQIVSLVETASDDVGSIYNQLRPLFPIFNGLQGLPVIGDYLGQAEPLLSYTDGLSRAASEIVTGLEPMLGSSSAGEMTLSIPEQISQAVQSGQAHFVNAAYEIDRAQQVRSRIRPELMPVAIRSVFLKIDDKFDLITAGARALQAAPKLLGVDEAQRYLVLAQNCDELRATGGFISGIGLATIQDGKVLQFDLGDSYQVDDFSKTYPSPPEALHRFMLADYWVTRDANWSPDFPSAAQEAQALYTISTGVQTQGVISFNQIAIKRILEVIGEVEVAGIDVLVSTENVEEYMRDAWAPAPEEGLSEEWWLHRKDFMQQLGNVLLDKIFQTSDPDQLMDLGKTLVELLDQGQVMVYFNDQNAQAAFKVGGLDGSVNPGSQDYLYLVDTNVGFNKVDSVIQRSIKYQVDLSDLNQPTGVVTLNYQHTGNGKLPCRQEISYGSGTYADMQQRCYLDYWRVYVPGGSEFGSSSAKAVPAEELLNGMGWSGQVERLTGEAGSQVLAGLLMLPPGQSTQINISYTLPSSVVVEETSLLDYALKVKVQPGLEGLPFQLEITLPENMSVIRRDAGWKEMNHQKWTWQGIINQVTELKLGFEVDSKQ